MNFESLVGQINHVQDVLQAQAAHAINLSLTARNWLEGCYIVEYEQHGEDRAKYGENYSKTLLKVLIGAGSVSVDCMSSGRHISFTRK